MYSSQPDPVISQASMPSSGRRVRPLEVVFPAIGASESCRVLFE